MMSSNPGLLVIDNNCYKDLVSPGRQLQLRRCAEMVDLTPAPSIVNLAETVCAPLGRRRVNLAAMRRLMGPFPLLPWPFDMLEATAHHTLGGPTPEYGETGFEWMLDDPEGAGETSMHTRSELLGAEDMLKQRFDAKRPAIQRRAKELNVRGHWDGARDFLDYWWESGRAADVAAVYWQYIGLPGDPPLVPLLKEEVWRLIIDAEALAMYGRCLIVEQTRQAGYIDLLQLIYLSLRRKRVLVTNDMPFHRAADVILTGRYETARVVTLDTMLA